MKRASYKEAIAWIALNDSAADGEAPLDVSITTYYLTSLLVADIFSVPEEKVGRDIVSFRKKNK